jgi:hypothetical protein
MQIENELSKCSSINMFHIYNFRYRWIARARETEWVGLVGSRRKQKKLNTEKRDGPERCGLRRRTEKKRTG